ncbi:hypothetical protein CBS101457_000023 [Exobasidium rhododendri]|nr:hypothetical protein CBS101457_000023 [Exobasidium rhododendri]
MTTITKKDVVIIGGGPVGLTIAYSLARMGLSTHIVEKFDKTQQAMYGRAATLYPRTSEMLDQLDLIDSLSQIGFIGKGSATFRDGKRIQGRGWAFIAKMTDTYYPHCLSIRQKYSENVIREHYEEFGEPLHAGHTLDDYSVDESSSDDYKVLSSFTSNDGKKYQVRSKYIVGADGGRSTVRHNAGISFQGESTTHRWVRIDAVFKTNMPDARVGFGAIESPTHGNVLWAALDHGRTRIGFALTPELFEKYGDKMTEEQAIHEAKESMKPFDLEVVTMDWHTVYSISQRVAATYQFKDRIILAGDACHTHSSGAAQGMNTGIHDAVNLGWKLAGVLKGWYTKDVLASYSEERRPIAQKLINLDKDVSSLISGSLPDNYHGPKDADVNLVLDDLFESSATFTTGLGVEYPEGTLLNKASQASTLRSGRRAPDVQFRKPGSPLPSRLYSMMKNTGKFWIIVFAGTPSETKEKLQTARAFFDGAWATKNKKILNQLTIIAGPGLSPDETLTVPRFGDAVYDVDLSAHTRYGFTTQEGGILVVRPDGVAGYATNLNTPEDLAEYFQGILA